jgi:predicted TIM-barrel fold metal-dependent hydrolase
MRAGLLAALTAAALCYAPLPPTAAAAAAQPAVPFAEILKIDVHSHVFEDIPALNEMLRRNNVRTMNVCNNGMDAAHFETMHRIALDLFRRHPDLFPFASTFALARINEPGWADAAIAWLDTTFANGAVATKIWKEVGLEVKKKDGTFMLPDDPVFDPIYAHLARRGKPLLAHLAEPIDAWLPLDPDSPHYGYYSTTPQWHLYGKPDYPSHAAIIAARDRIMEKHPTLTLIGAHLGSLEHDLDAIAQRLDRYPNFNVEVAARTRNLVRHPSDKVRAFFIKYQDRIMYGVDASWKPFLAAEPPTDAQRQSHVKRLEERYREDFEYYAGTGTMQYGGRQVKSLGLPRDVLEKFYNRNARRLIAFPESAPAAARD